MTTRYISTADTAKLIRQALKEAFPGVKFSVRSDTYSGGSSIRVSWIDGPNDAQVRDITQTFCGGYFDGSIDYKGSIYHMIDGEPVHFGADFVFTNRDYSDTAIQRGINRMMAKFSGNFASANMPAPTVEQYRSGKLYSVPIPGLEDWGNIHNIQKHIADALGKHTYTGPTKPSKTASKVMVTHDDGYSRACGAGFSAVSI